MEVADQWRRQWTGTAEYGKVTEGGVTRRIARAMEVLHASAPGAKVRVMRAAYHSSAGPGAPTSSYLMHSSRRVISSGYHPDPTLALPSKPLEVSSMPLESSPEVDSEKLSYKVTEPDDFEISEPSKWRNATGKSSTRMPSEESSSTDNASIIDLDSRNSSRNTLTRSFRNSNENAEDSIKNIHMRNNRVSPLLDAPVSLSTLKYTSLLNGSEEWNNRRKSYSFEDTTSLNSKSNFHKPDIFHIMDSSTDSGICKSTEIVSDHNTHSFENSSRRISKERLYDLPEESFQDWLCKNRSTTTFKPTSISPLKEYQEKYLTNENNMISLQSKGKVTITLPVTIEKDDKDSVSLSTLDDIDKKTKKVGFSKTELHFAAESGTVNIIATDEKPPPSNDFRKKKSVFAPYNQKVDKSITLFGEKSVFLEVPNSIDLEKQEYLDENTAATKGILKNRIPKPKPYLLGENMALGEATEGKLVVNTSFPTAVTLINKQLEIDENHINIVNKKTTENVTYDTDRNSLRTLHTGSQKYIKTTTNDKKPTPLLKDEYKPLSLTNTNGKLKTRQLRDSDLTYFGIQDKIHNEKLQTLDNLQEEILHSVKLVQRISNSVCNSEAESDDGPEYQNISNIKYCSVPTPKPRTKYIDITKRNQNKLLKSISEVNNDDQKKIQSPKLKNTEEEKLLKNKTFSEKEKEPRIIRNKGYDVTKRSTSLNRLYKKPDKSKGNEDVKHYSSSTKTEETMYVNIAPKKNLAVIALEGRNSPIKTKLNNNNSGVNTIRGINEITKNIHSKSDVRKPKRTEKLTTPDLPITRKDSRTVSSKTIFSRPSIKVDNQSLEKQKVNNYTDNLEIYKKHKNESSKDTGRIHENKDSNSSRRSINYIKKTENLSPNVQPLKSKEASQSTERSSSKTRKSKYVINYDDKNGAVSSIRKLKPTQDNLRRKEPLQKVPTTDNKMKVKISKTGFLQIPDQHWLTKEVQHTKTHARKSCHLL